ncbi:hypothetical protein LMG33818_000623 [Halomonadaceae bacterium LMG 33818]
MRCQGPGRNRRLKWNVPTDGVQCLNITGEPSSIGGLPEKGLSSIRKGPRKEAPFSLQFYFITTLFRHGTGLMEAKWQINATRPKAGAATEVLALSLL